MRSKAKFQGRLGGWLACLAGVSCAVLSIGRPAGAITITEILYDPPGTPQEKLALKYVEIFNDETTTIDLTGYRFAEGIVYDFPPGTLFGPRKYLVIAANSNALKARFGIANVLGDFAGTLDPEGEQLLLVNESGGVVAKVEFQDRGQWSSIPTGTGYSLSVRNPYLNDDRAESWTSSARPGGTPGGDNFPPPTIVEAEIFGEDSPWRYAKGWDGVAMAPFSTPPAAWHETAFDDAGWLEGNTGIGFGDPVDDRTVLGDMRNNYFAFAARKRFTISPEIRAEMEGLNLRLRIDDGYVAYLNGEEIGRLNVGTTPEVPFDQPATATRDLSISYTPILRPIPLDKLLPGENVLAVEIHNRLLTDSDCGLVTSLLWRKTVYGAVGTTVAVRLNEVIREPESGGERWLELFNAGDAAQDLGGFSLTNDPAFPDRYVIPPKRQITGGGFLSFPESVLGFSLAGSGSRKELRLYLYEPDRSLVVDAAILDTRMRTSTSGALSQARIPDGGDTWFLSTTPTPEATNAAPLERDVVINEIMYHPMAGPTLPLADGRVLEKGEFIEIYNRSDQAIPLGRWAFTKGYNFVFPDDLVLPGNSYLVLAPDPQYIALTYSLPPEKVLGPAATPEARAAFGVLSNSGETIRLEDPLGNRVEEVRYYDDGQWSSLADGGGSSLELIDPLQDHSLPGAWAASDETARAPWTQYSYSANNVALAESELWFLLLDDGQCLIDEVSVKKAETEYIPNGGFEVNTIPWRITGTHIRSRRITTEAHAGTGCLQLIASGAGDNRVNRVEVDASPAIPSGAVTVSFWARWLQGCQRLQSSGNNNNTLAMNNLLAVPPDLGTPGKENSVRAKLRAATGSDNLGPVIGEVVHVPAVPRASDPVTVLARISDHDGVAEAAVEYRLSRRSAPMSTAPLFDDGQHGDGRAGDGLYAGTIPASANLAKVLFNIAARDAGGRWRRLPVDAPEHTLLYQVGESYTSPALRYRLVLDDDNKAALEGRLLHSDDLVDGAFVFEESVPYYNIGVRYHGSPWNRPGSPLMFSLRFRGDKSLRGYTRINISRYGSQLNEGTAYHLIQRASGGETARTPYTPRYNYLKFYYNGQPHAVSAMAELIPPGGDYYRTIFPQDGDGYSYKITGKLEFNDQGSFTNNIIWTQFRYYGPSKESYRYYFNPATSETEDNFEPLMRLLEIFDPTRTPMAKFEDPATGIETILNVEAFLRVLIIRVLHDDWDTIGIGNGQNASIYYAPREGRFYLVPWDMDHTFNTGATASARLLPSDLSTDFAVRRLVNDSSKYRRVYFRILKEFTSTFWSVNGLDPWLNSINNDLKGGLAGGPEGIRGFISSRLSTLNSRFPFINRTIEFAITQPPGGRPFAVKASEATFGGTAPFEIAKFYLETPGSEAQEVTPTWVGSTSTDWRLKVPVQRGKNTFRVFGFNTRGEPVGSAQSIDIYDATDWAAPTITRIEPAEGPLAGGTPVTITGTSFQPGSTVFFGAAPAQGLERVSDTELRMVCPVGTALGAVDVKVLNLDAQSAVAAGGFAYRQPGSAFIRGDFDGTGVLDITDVFDILDYMYREYRSPCLRSGDVDDNSVIEITDPVYLLQYMYLAGPPPPAPFPQPGTDSTPDSLDCGG